MKMNKIEKCFSSTDDSNLSTFFVTRDFLNFGC